MSKKISLLVIGWVWPEPKASAAGSHMLNLLGLLKTHWDITFASTAKQTELSADLSQLGIQSRLISLNDASFDDFIRSLNPAMVLFDRFMMEEQFGWRVAQCCPEAIRVLDTEDLQCLRHARHEAFKQQRPVNQNDYFSNLAKREIAAIYRCDISLIISNYEQQWLQDTFKLPADLLQHLPFILKPQQSVSHQNGFEQRRHFISLGNFRHAPNWDAVLYLNQLWPRIRQQLPTAELHIYGAYMPPKAQALHRPQKGFIVKGWVDNALELMENARVCLAPLRFGAGLKGKLLDAMLSATPSITSTIGAEGMHGELDWPGHIYNSEDDLLEAAINLYQNPSQWQTASRQCDALVRLFSDSKAADDFITRLQNWLAAPGLLQQHRLNNFTGAMLQHHQHKSTQYMSQWIEAKNRLSQLEEAQKKY